MKNQYFILAFVIFLVINACSSTSIKKISFGDSILELELPDQYKIYDKESLNKLINSEDTENKNAILGSFMMQFMLYDEMRLLIDSNSYYNCISITNFDGSIYLDREFLKGAGYITSLRLMSQYEKVGGYVVPIEGIIRDGKHYRYMKLKYKLLIKDKSFLYANYLVRLKDKVISIGVLNEKENDFEDKISESALYLIKNKN